MAKGGATQIGKANANANANDTDKSGDVGTPGRATLVSATMDDVLNPSDVDFNSADQSVVASAARDYTNNIYDALDRASASAIDAMEEPPPAAPKSLALQLLASIVEALGVVAFDYALLGLLELVERTEMKKQIDKVKLNTVLASATANMVRGLDPSQKALSASKSTLPHMLNPAAKTLAEEFKARMQQSLGQRRTRALVATAQMVAQMRYDRNRAVALVDLLQTESADLSDLTSDYQKNIMAQWLNFKARVSVPDGNIDEVAPMTGPSGSYGVNPQAWRVAQGGIDIDIDVPERIWGTNGLQLRSVSVDDQSPGLKRALQNVNDSILNVPALRRVWFHNQSGGKLSTEVGMVIYSSGAHIASPNSIVLQEIGKLAPTQPGDLSAKPLPSQSAPGASAAIPRLELRDLSPTHAEDKQRAELGATLLFSWLGSVSTANIK